MKNSNSEDIDKLFREGLNHEKDDLPFLERDWSKLKERLDRNEKRKRAFFWLSRLSGIAALLLLFIVIRMLIPESRNPVLQQAEVQQKEQHVKEQQKPSLASGENKTAAKTISGTNALVALNKPVKARSPGNHVSIQTPEKTSPEKDTVGVANISIPQRTKEKTSTSEEHPTTPTEATKPTEKKQPEIEESLFAPGEKPLEKPEAEHQLRLLALSVLAAPDYNGVNNLNNASLGDDFGLMLTVKLARSWSFSTGGIYAKKLYETGFSNYNPSKNIWTEYYPNSVNADCRVLDIPMNINYSFLKRKNNSFSLGTGISSYIMIKENYRFTYTQINANNPQAYQVVNENRHWLSVLNFQASFEQRLNSRLSLSIQPYLKIPLSDIGFAGVKLQSFGLAATLNWNFK